MRTIIRSAAFLVGAALASAANAELINLDFSAGITTPSGPAPASTYGGAAGQPGFWNNVNSPTAVGVPMNDLAGNPTGVTLTLTGGGFMFNAETSNPNGVITTTGSNDELLMDDVWDSPTTNATITFNNLAAGNYKVVVYGGSPDSGTTTMNFIIGADSKFVGGQWSSPFSFQEGITHATFNVAHAGGNLVISVPDVPGFESVNGVQIAAIPEPATVGLLAAGAAMALRRRRRRH